MKDYCTIRSSVTEVRTSWGYNRASWKLEPSVSHELPRIQRLRPRGHQLVREKLIGISGTQEQPFKSLGTIWCYLTGQELFTFLQYFSTLWVLAALLQSLLLKVFDCLIKNNWNERTYARLPADIVRCTVINRASDPYPHCFRQLNPDPHLSEKLDSDPDTNQH